ncbi:hypothetical protein [Chitinophaga sp. 212800010-3]|uniref:hypothetical protein n=1 Tax=unclassified Chitinophaga TaxID=2619133 RepID=UPI002DF0B05E|nr:hypothetical protein [Chitinophaga sp. 212800010-3]
MKKSKLIALTSVLGLAITACRNTPRTYNDEWISGNEQKDTIVNNNHYRYYGGYWYPVYYNRINPGRYNGASFQEISTSSFRPSVRSAGFGSSAHSSAGE